MSNRAEDPEPIRPHTYDGIQEYDKRLPNWWLFTLYGSIVFSIAYWAWHQTYEMSPPPGLALEEEMQENARLAAQNSTEVTDRVLWDMSRDAQAVAAGKATYLTTCAACHLPDMSGLVGPNMKDQNWVHGGKPLDLLKVVVDGIPAKGMPTWGPILGQQKIKEALAYILSFHTEGEPVNIVPWVPGGAVPAIPPAAVVTPAAVIAPVN
jgi:cytochrome c oxidase cbb3-type subunit III